ncbi:armadillo repeat-containing protein 7 [Callorhinchus milii]|uniref:Armadillo repeat-containing protein 7-like protein n=1 Tax=Callorhinchus milii TaxID=7868 RepID=K4FXS1_CALMI|nr:armadillo repeat-containing protein 7 [Callorhinchus milii]AFK10537.1 armadillo repeat-containing protein 7-like protein [Callorhinchus milii]
MSISRFLASKSQGQDRFEYLQTLVTEFQDTDSQDSKEQILANLANFAYDPANYQYLRQLQVIDLFLDMLTEENETFIEFGIGGLCNLCLDKENKEYILQNNGVQAVMNCLSSSHEDTVLSAITTLMYLMSPASREAITGLPVVECMLRFSISNHRRLSNLATLFLEDYCSAEQVARARDLQNHTALGIPLPKGEADEILDSSHHSES